MLSPGKHTRTSSASMLVWLAPSSLSGNGKYTRTRSASTSFPGNGKHTRTRSVSTSPSRRWKHVRGSSTTFFVPTPSLESPTLTFIKATSSQVSTETSRPRSTFTTTKDTATARTPSTTNLRTWFTGTPTQFLDTAVWTTPSAPPCTNGPQPSYTSTIGVGPLFVLNSNTIKAK